MSAFLVKRRGKKSLGEFSKEIGIPKFSLSRYESGKQSMSLGVLEKILRALGASVADVFGTQTRKKLGPIV